MDREISMRVSVSVCKLQETQVDEFKTVKNCSLTTDSAFQNEPCGESRKSITTSNRQSPKNLSNSDSTESVCIKPKVGRKRRACPYNGTEVLIEEEAVGNIRRKSETAKRISSPVKSLRRSSRLSCLRKNEFETRVKVDAIPEESCNSAVADTDAEKYEENVNKRRGRNGPATANSLKSEEKVLEVSVINLSDTSLKTKPDVNSVVSCLLSLDESDTALIILISSSFIQIHFISIDLPFVDELLYRVLCRYANHVAVDVHCRRFIEINCSIYSLSL
ncbi:unnamed protein product [Trichobilharzia regenti]|nr:unnamed protein product [Trichobilharzia regenti]